MKNLIMLTVILICTAKDGHVVTGPLSWIDDQAIMLLQPNGSSKGILYPFLEECHEVQGDNK